MKLAKSIGMIEFSSIVRGIETSDVMTKAADVEIVRSCTICPGKYIVIVAGNTGEVEAAMQTGLKSADEYTVDSMMISNVHDQLIPAISMTTQVKDIKAIGALEYYSVASAIKAADVAVKAANVTLIEVKTGYAIGGKGVVVLTGDVGAVTAAINAAYDDSDLILQKTVIPRPDKELLEALL